MDLRKSFRALWRHRIATFAILFLALASTLGAAIKLPWSYKASTTVILLDSSKSSAADASGNPYLSFNTSLVQTANVLAIELGSPQVTEALQAQNYTAAYQAQVLSENPENEEPFIQISVGGSNANTVENTLHGAVTELTTLLASLQTQVSPDARAALQVISIDTQPSRSTGAKIKPLVGFLGLGLVLTFIIPQVIEGIAIRRRSRDRKDAVEWPERLPRDMQPTPDSKWNTQVPVSSYGAYPSQRPRQEAHDEFGTRQMDRSPARPEYGVPRSDSDRPTGMDRRP